MNYVIDFHNIKCPPGQSVSISQCGLLTSHGDVISIPHLYEHYILTFVIKGEGTYSINDTVYSVKAGQGMFTAPDTVTYWTTSATDPWQYIFVALNGSDCKDLLYRAGLGTHSKIFDFTLDDGMLGDLFAIYESGRSDEPNEYDMIGHFYLVMNRLAKTLRSSAKESTNIYLENAIIFIDNNYCYNITVNDIAEHLNIERTYLYKIFTRELGVSPIQFLTEYRLKKAIQMMYHDNFSTATIATSAGFYDFSHFSRAFHKKYGMPPGKYRRQLLASDKKN